MLGVLEAEAYAVECEGKSAFVTRIWNDLDGSMSPVGPVAGRGWCRRPHRAALSYWLSVPRIRGKETGEPKVGVCPVDIQAALLSSYTPNFHERL